MPDESSPSSQEKTRSRSKREDGGILYALASTLGPEYKSLIGKSVAGGGKIAVILIIAIQVGQPLVSQYLKSQEKSAESVNALSDKLSIIEKTIDSLPSKISESRGSENHTECAHLAEEALTAVKAQDYKRGNAIREIMGSDGCNSPHQTK